MEDEEDTRRLIERLLTNSGYRVAVAGHGVDALMQLGHQTFDLVLSDVDMPSLDGFKLLELVQLGEPHRGGHRSRRPCGRRRGNRPAGG